MRFGPQARRSAGVCLNVSQVNCYDIVGETDVKTEGTLRARIERAGACTPCVMLLRNIDALAKTGQALETGRGLCYVVCL